MISDPQNESPGTSAVGLNKSNRRWARPALTGMPAQGGRNCVRPRNVPAPVGILQCAPNDPPTNSPRIRICGGTSADVVSAAPTVGEEAEILAVSKPSPAEPAANKRRQSRRVY